MGLISAFNNYSTLTEEQKEFVEKKYLEGAHTPGEWIAMFRQIATFDQSGDALRKVLGWTMFLSLLLGFILSIVAQNFIIFGLAALVFVAALVLFLKFRKHDVPNDLREFVLPLVTVLREDIDPDARLTLKLDLRKGTTAEKRTGSTNITDPRFLKGVQNSYVNEWITGEGTLVEGTSLAWGITDHIREREITKRTPRGKIKTKTKYKIKRVIDVRVGLKNDSYQLVDTASGGTDNTTTTVKQGEKRNVFKGRKIVMATSLGEKAEIADLLDLISGAYRRVSLTKAEG